ncbi:hypothetical protein [Methylocapsa palsarum]|uniref:hypothetical protein n=1 Tax=Methylocapsa palsarum TaxID=1612308 RepID=UPI00111358EE|nr:hypothetical protein [Methylocapsa palsarum]
MKRIAGVTLPATHLNGTQQQASARRATLRWSGRQPLAAFVAKSKDTDTDDEKGVTANPA